MVVVFFLGVFIFFSCQVAEGCALSFFTFAADLPGEPKRGCSLRKKKFDFPLDKFLRKRLNERPFPLHGGASISKFFDSHLICAIDTVSVQYNKTFTYSEPASNGFYFSCGFCLGKNLSKNCTKKNSSAKESVHCGREPKFGSSGFRTLFRISFLKKDFWRV